MKKPIVVILEKGDGELWGRIEGIGDFLPVTVGKNKQEIQLNLCELIKDYLAHEGNNDSAWQGFNPNHPEFEYRYDIQAFFEEFGFLKQSKIAEEAGINPGLLRQYASGIKHPSAEQAMKIELAIHRLANSMQKATLFVG
jgi:hypothetical protein